MAVSMLCPTEAAVLKSVKLSLFLHKRNKLSLFLLAYYQHIFLIIEKSFFSSITKLNMKYRERPVVIEAVQFNGMDDYMRIVQWMKDSNDTYALANEVEYRTPIMIIQTLEGAMAANPGDWIIKGVNSEFYPCKNEIFLKTYEKVE